MKLGVTFLSSLAVAAFSGCAFSFVNEQSLPKSASVDTPSPPPPIPNGKFVGAISPGSTGSWAGQVYPGDFNGDGQLDLLTYHSNSLYGSVFINQGDFTFGDRIDLTMTGTSSAAGVGDLDSDGNLDAIVTKNSGTSANICIFRGNGDGTFAAPVCVNGPSGMKDLAIADMNGDGKLDLIHRTPTAFGYMRNTSAAPGSFTFAATVNTTGLGDGLIVAADLDLDGDNDLVVTQTTTNYVAVYLNNGSGTLTRTDYTVSIATPSAPYNVVVDDFNQDGKPDIAVKSRNSTVDTLSVLLGDASGTFPSFQEYPASSQHSLASGDINGDGHKDLIYYSYDEGTCYYHPGDGSGSFGTPVKMPLSLEVTGITFADLNADGLQDLLYATNGGDSVGVSKNAGGGFFHVTQLSDPVPGDHQYSRQFALADLDHDGVDENIFTDSTFSNLVVLKGTAWNTFTTETLYPSGGFTPSHFLTKDLNSDTHIDIVVGNHQGSSLAVFKNDGTGALTRSLLTTGTNPMKPIAEDFDGDGIIDLVVPNLGSGTVSFFKGDGLGGFAAKVDSTTGGQPHSVVVHDFDGDGDLDLLITDIDTTTLLKFYLNNGSGSFTAGNTYPTCDSPKGIARGDIDSDGIADIVVQCNYAFSFYVGQAGASLGAMTTLVTALPFNSTSAEWVTLPVRLVDLNADGKLDLIGQNILQHSMVVSLNPGNGVFTKPTLYDQGAPTSSFELKDVTGDAVPDIVYLTTSHAYLSTAGPLNVRVGILRGLH